MKKKHTERGFSLYEFTDRYGSECSLKKSSLATEDAIWLGSDKMNIQEFVAGKGWIKRPEFDVHTMEHHYVGSNRMHLTQEMVKDLLPILQKFAETGEI